MSEKSETEETPQAEANDQRPPWYSLDLGALTGSRLMRAVLIVLVAVSFSVVPLWRLLWFYPVYGFGNFVRVKDTRGRAHEAWRWVEGREIRVYQLPDIRPGEAERIAAGVTELLQEAGLDLTVTVQPIPEEVLEAYNASLEKKVVSGQETDCVNFSQLEARLIELRKDDPHADMLVTGAPIAECWWAHGMATFRSGMALLVVGHVNKHLGKHESCHLIGYIMHDSFPLFVVGYPWEGSPWSRDTLMLLYGRSDELSPRARDALRYFWRGLEKRTGEKYLKPLGKAETANISSSTE